MKEPGGRHPEVVTNQHHALNVCAVALPQSIYQLRVGHHLVRVQPLLELIQHNQHLATAAQHAPANP